MADWTRRRFLTRTGAAAGGVVAATAAGGLPAVATDADTSCSDLADPARFDPSDWASVRDQFALRRDRLHFSAWGLASPPRPVRAAIAEHRDALDADTFAAMGREVELDGAVLTAAEKYLRTGFGQVALTDSTTMGLGLVYGGVALQPGDDVLSTEHEFYSSQEALRLATSRAGATLRKIALYDSPVLADVDQIVTRLVSALEPRTKIVALTWVHSGTGVKLPIAELSTAITRTAWDLGIERPLICVDGVHGFGVEDTTPNELGCDVLISGTHKWLFGPRGTGIVWAKPPAWERIVPTIPTFDQEGLGAGIRGVASEYLTPGGANSPGGFKAFEHRWATTQAFEFMSAIGPDRVAAYTHEQVDAMIEGLAPIETLRIATPRGPGAARGLGLPAGTRR